MADVPLCLEASVAPVAIIADSQPFAPQDSAAYPGHGVRGWSPSDGSTTCIASIHILPSDVLLQVFKFYRQTDPHRWSRSYSWIVLSHVCRRWR
ncbi:hypothetical protein BC834DRAFT_887584 [Gloeopeniophorella convolvens]|nr:hypothetical protein BC834DRAFT_887584 [Gloeopeniophorella convolvens]